MGAMSFPRRLSAGILAVLLALLPSTLEQCRIACLSEGTTPVAATSSHECHEVTPTDPAGTHLASPSKACKHRNSGGAYDPPKIAAAKGRSASVVAVPAVSPHLHAAVVSVSRDSVHGHVHPLVVSPPLTLPLRL